jgi:hypothetical protein
MISRLIENKKLLHELANAEALTLIDGLDEQKVSYSTIYKLKLFGAISNFSIFEQIKRKYLKLLHRLFTDPLSEASAEALRQRMFAEKETARSELASLLEKERESDGPHDPLSIYYRYVNLIN